MSSRPQSQRDKLAKQQRENLETEYVNLYRRAFNTNSGLWTVDIKNMSLKQLEDGIVAFDMLLRLIETKQVYIVGHDVPLSISKRLFEMLDARRIIEAQKKKLPEDQYEFEDVLGLFLGLSQ